MPFNTQGWLESAERWLGPLSKVNGGVNPVDGFVAHSAEGPWSAMKDQLANAPVSWTFSNLKDGRLFEHYPITAQCWHSANSYGNNQCVSMEHEGKAGDALTEAQINNTVMVIRELAAYRGWVPVRLATLWEHKELFNTACPSGRIPWDEILRQLQGEDELAGIARRNGNIIEFTNTAGFVILRLGNEDGSDGSRLQVPEGDPANGGRWRTYKKSGAKMPDGSDIIVLE